jgi:hypothetical protein
MRKAAIKKTTVPKKTTPPPKATFVVGAPLPAKLPRKAKIFFSSAVTPQAAYDLIAKVSKIEEKRKTPPKTSAKSRTKHAAVA